MAGISRRTALSLGSAGLITAAPFLMMVGSASAKPIPKYGPDDGTELSPGIRWVDVGEIHSEMDAYKTIKYGDAIYQPGAADPIDQPLMDSDMVCYILSGRFKIEKKGIEPFIVDTGEAYTCGIGKSDRGTNISDEVGLMRVVMLMAS